MRVMFDAVTLAALAATAHEMLENFKNERIFCLFGEMGAGKTTLIQELCKILDVNDKVVSPTYQIVNEYSTKDGPAIIHMDLYRIKEERELVELGFEEYISSGNYCFIEWPEQATSLLNTSFVKIDVSRKGEELHINMTKHD